MNKPDEVVHVFDNDRIPDEDLTIRSFISWPVMAMLYLVLIIFFVELNAVVEDIFFRPNFEQIIQGLEEEIQRMNENIPVTVRDLKEEIRRRGNIPTHKETESEETISDLISLHKRCFDEITNEITNINDMILHVECHLERNQDEINIEQINESIVEFEERIEHLLELQGLLEFISEQNARKAKLIHRRNALVRMQSL